jgi:hypothetical protein
VVTESIKQELMMKRGLLCIVIMAGAVATAAGEQQVGGGIASATIEQGPGGVNIVRPRMAVESRITKNAPYSGEAISEFVQTLSDGNRITRRTVTKTFRDSEGRTRREQTITNFSTGAEMISILIGDPVAGVSYVLEPDTRTAHREQQLVATVMPGARGGGAGAAVGGGGRGGVAVRTYGHDGAVVTTMPAQAPTPATGQAGIKVAEPGATTEQLGQKVIEGVMAEGTRTTTIIAAGAIGNEQPIKVVSEQWFSPDLQVLVSTRHSDPRSGETVYRLVNIVRGEPDRALFEVPADYTIRESRMRQPMMKSPE